VKPEAKRTGVETTAERRQVKYTPAGPIDVESFLALGSATNMGAEVLAGKPEAWVRVDFSRDGMSAGLFMGSPGKVRYTFPSTEHATIVEGEVTFTDEAGNSETYRPGDSYLIQQGTLMTVASASRFVKSFFNYKQNITPG
jgi:uncharacterized cupin superfamily protein